MIVQARRQTAYSLVWQDWLWHMIFPCGPYVGLTIAAALLRPSPRGAAFVIGSAALVLLLIAIHNAWDTVTFVVLDSDDKESAGDRRGTSREAISAPTGGDNGHH